MLYRTMPGTGESVSILGFGAMRLPLADPDDPASIDRPRAAALVRRAVDRGVNVVDTAWPYHGGESEPFLAEALSDGYREKVLLSTKLPTYLVEAHGDFDRYLDRQLDRLGTPSVDFYLLHALNRERWAAMQEHGFASFLDRALADGRVRHAGFSFHGDRELFRDIVDRYPWSLCLIMYNYLDENFQAGREGLLHAAARGLGVMVMEPLRGGRLASNVPPAVADIWSRAPVRRSPAAWALRWVWNHPEVSVALSGMSAPEQLEENLDTAGQGLPGSLSQAELDVVGRVKAAYRERMVVGCTSCGYCLPCPEGVAITGCFHLLNNAGLFDAWDKAREAYPRLIPEDRRASRCTACGACEDKCPQNLPVRETLRLAVRRLEDPDG